MKRWYRKIGVWILLCLLLCSPETVQAVQVNNGAVYPISTNEIEGWPQGPDLYAETAILMDADTGAILFNKGMDEIRYPASITKIMTCLLALERNSLEESVTFTETCLADQAPGSGNAGMQVGEVLTMEQCLLIMMVRSANDVATQVAEHVGGSVSAFVDLMNQRAQELGCVNTHFVNASGMPDDNHYSTAHDMALIFQEAIKSETFREIIGTQDVIIPPTNMNPEVRTYSTHHPLVALSAPEHYEGCIGGKTGVTDAARNTLVSGAVRNGMTLIAVAMRADMGQVCQDHINLFNYGFDQFHHVEVPGGMVTLPVSMDLSSLEAVETESDGVTYETYYYQGSYQMGSGRKEEPTPEEAQPQELVPEIAEDGTEAQPETQPESETNASDSAKTDEMKKTYGFIIGLLAALVVIALLITVVSAVLQSKRKKKRKKKKQNKKKQQ